jgi:potassium-transporting ATPase KdpC subunit
MIRSLLAKTGLLLVLLTAFTGFCYPLFITAVGNILFPRKAQGSIVFDREGDAVGSSLIGQYFEDPKYFWGRPSATPDVPYNSESSGGSNLSPSAPRLAALVRERVERLRDADPGNRAPVPIDLVTASGSGLDPSISPAAARYQADRVARARGLDPSIVYYLIDGHIERRAFGILGEKRVNVLLLNMELDAIEARGGENGGGTETSGP